MQDSFLEKHARKNYCRNQTQPLNMMSCQLWQRLQCKRCLRAIVQPPRLGLRFLIRQRRVNLQNKPRTSRCVFSQNTPHYNVRWKRSEDLHLRDALVGDFRTAARRPTNRRVDPVVNQLNAFMRPCRFRH